MQLRVWFGAIALVLGWLIGISAVSNRFQAGSLRPEHAIEDAAQWIRDSYVREYWQALGSPDFVKTITLMNYVQERVQPARYGRLAQEGRLLPQTPQECLQQGAGICGNQVEVFLAIAKRLGLRGRSAQFYWRDAQGNRNSHIAVEVFYDEKWHYFDITWGTYFVASRLPENPLDVCRALSLDKVLALKDPEKHSVGNRLMPWYRLQKCSGLNPFDYLRGEELSILRGLDGTVTYDGSTGDVKSGDGGVTLTPLHLPDYVGVRDEEGTSETGNTSVRLPAETVGVSNRLLIDVKEMAGHGELRVRRGSWENRIPLRVEDKVASIDVNLTETPECSDVLIDVIPAPTSRLYYIRFHAFRLQ